MKYISTRGQAAPADFAEVLLAGLAPDGGLYVPEQWPAFTPTEIALCGGGGRGAVALHRRRLPARPA
jgi:threonine synthase